MSFFEGSPRGMDPELAREFAAQSPEVLSLAHLVNLAEASLYGADEIPAQAAEFIGRNLYAIHTLLAIDPVEEANQRMALINGVEVLLVNQTAVYTLADIRRTGRGFATGIPTPSGMVVAMADASSGIAAANRDFVSPEVFSAYAQKVLTDPLRDPRARSLIIGRLFGDKQDNFLDIIPPDSIQEQYAEALLDTVAKFLEISYSRQLVQPTIFVSGLAQLTDASTQAQLTDWTQELLAREYFKRGDRLQRDVDLRLFITVGPEYLAQGIIFDRSDETFEAIPYTLT